MNRRIVLVMSQFPFDPASGAARSLRTMCEMLPPLGWDVCVVGNLRSGAASGDEPLAMLSKSGISAREEHGPTGAGSLRFVHKGVEYCLTREAGSAERSEKDLTSLLEAVSADFAPEVALTMGGSTWDRARRAGLRERGTPVVFGLRNHGYYHHAAFEDVDAVLTPSVFLSECYRKRLGLRSTPLPTPISREDSVASEHHQLYFTFVNPSWHKGVGFFSALLRHLAAARSDIPFLVVESLSDASSVVLSGGAGPEEWRSFDHVAVSRPVHRPADFFAPTRCLLVPSVWEEPSARVVAEALCNHLPVIASDRGGLPESVGNGGWALPIPSRLAPETIDRVDPDEPEVVAWASLIERLADDEHAYAAACRNAAKSSARFDPFVLGPKYAAFFEGVTLGSSVW
ncbi:MAG: glycosyltransferase [Phycisphaerales bacterium]